MKRIYRMALFGAEILTLASGCSELNGPPTDTSQWRIQRDEKWGFALSTPPSWPTIDGPSNDPPMVIREQLPSGPELRCAVYASLEATTANKTQNQLNAYIMLKGPTDPRTMSAVLSAKHLDNRITVYSDKAAIVNGYPAYVQEMSSVLTSTSRPLFSYTLTENVFVVRKDFSVTCETYHYDRGLAEKAYRENLPTFRAVLDSFVVL